MQKAIPEVQFTAPQKMQDNAEGTVSRAPTLDIRSDFPILSRQVHGERERQDTDDHDERDHSPLTSLAG